MLFEFHEFALLIVAVLTTIAITTPKKKTQEPKEMPEKDTFKFDELPQQSFALELAEAHENRLTRELRESLEEAKGLALTFWKSTAMVGTLFMISGACAGIWIADVIFAWISNA